MGAVRIDRANKSYIRQRSGPRCRVRARRTFANRSPINDVSLRSTVLHPSAVTIFSEKYRVVAVDSQSLVVRGVVSGKVLVINADPEFPLNQQFFPVGKLIELSDPSSAPSE